MMMSLYIEAIRGGRDQGGELVISDSDLFKIGLMLKQNE